MWCQLYPSKNVLLKEFTLYCAKSNLAHCTSQIGQVLRALCKVRSDLTYWLLAWALCVLCEAWQHCVNIPGLIPTILCCELNHAGPIGFHLSRVCLWHNPVHYSCIQMTYSAVLCTFPACSFSFLFSTPCFRVLQGLAMGGLILFSPN